jgi:hypothetical protein
MGWMMLESLTHESFEPHVGTGFAIEAGEYAETLTLTEVKPRQPLAGFDRAPFSLSFTGASNELMFHSQTYEMRHPELGTLPIMISPTGRNDDGTFRYEAVFG